MNFEVERMHKILTVLNQAIVNKEMSLQEIMVSEEWAGPQRKPQEWSTFALNQRWGGRDYHCWFKTQVVVPEEIDGERLAIWLRTGKEGEWDAINPQFLLYVNGEILQGMDINHTRVTIAEKAKAGDCYTLEFAAYAGMTGGLCEFQLSAYAHMTKVEKLYYNLLAIHDTMKLFSKEEKHFSDLANYSTNAINCLDLRQIGSATFYQSINQANEYLETEFYETYCGHNDVIATCVGHTHIDVAWLWQLKQTEEKAVRSFSTVLNMMKEYDDYIFMSSQPELYEYVKKNAPGIYEQIKERVKEGRWEPEGAMWIEADCNLTSGESLIRQILHGKRFFREEFGVDSKVLWLPDVFGYSAAIPQILRKCGVDYFITSKISWNEYNQMPYDTFVWKGIDGSEIFTQFITTKDIDQRAATHYTTYNGYIQPSTIEGGWKGYRHKAINNNILIPFGYGDGGGSATRGQLEMARRMQKGIPGIPRVKMGKVLDYMKETEETVMKTNRCPKWVGELYLEYHRGTYTSMARNKKYNRNSEFLYENVELLSSMDLLLLGNAYPCETIEHAWKTILLNQFHDIIPGSSIKEVYDDSKEQYEAIKKQGEDILSDSMLHIAKEMNLTEESLVVFNSTGFLRSDMCEANINGEMKKIYVENIPAKGYKAIPLSQVKSLDEKSEHASGMVVESGRMENRFFKLTLNEQGFFTSMYDKVNQREMLQVGKLGNEIQVFEDIPHNYDAWDINIYYQEKMWSMDNLTKVEVIDEGIRGGLRLTRSFLDSTFVQTIYLYEDIERIDFDTYIDWKETHLLVKAAFPVDVLADKATYEIQYGNVERPTHWNTSWDKAKFETCAHKWCDLSENGYGISLLNDCKYGHDIKESNMRLTLLKSANDPNPEADREEHRFMYSVYPHKGEYEDGKTIPMAYFLNCPMMTKVEPAHKGLLATEYSLARTNEENAVIEVIKQAESGDGLIIRLYESCNKRTRVTLTLAKEIAKAYEVTMLEDMIEAMAFHEDSMDFELKPFEIKTIKVLLK